MLRWLNLLLVTTYKQIISSFKIITLNSQNKKCKAFFWDIKKGSINLNLERLSPKHLFKLVLIIYVLVLLTISNNLQAATFKTSQNAISNTTVASDWNPPAVIVSGDSIIYGGNHIINVLAASNTINVIDTAANPVVGPLYLSGDTRIGSIGSSGGGGSVSIIKTDFWATQFTATGMSGGGGIAVNDYSKLESFDFNNYNSLLHIVSPITLPTNFFSTGGTNGVIQANANVTFNGTFSSTPGNELVHLTLFNSSSTFTIDIYLMGELGLTNSNLILGANRNITIGALVLFHSNNITFPSDATIKTSEIKFEGNTNNITFNNSFDNTATTAMTFNNSSSNTITFGINAALRLTDLTFSGTSSNNTLIVPSTSAPTTDPITVAFGTSVANNNVSFPNNRTFSSAILNFSSTGTNNQVSFGAGTTFNSFDLTFASIGTNNQLNFGANNIINNAAGTWNISGLYGRKITFGADNELTLDTFYLSNITNSNLVFGSNNTITIPNLTFQGANTLTFPSDSIIKTTNINFIADTNNITFNNSFDNTSTTIMNFFSSYNTLTFDSNAALRLTTISVSGSSSNNALLVPSTPAPTTDPLTITFSGTSNNNSVIFPANRTFPSTNLTFSSTGTNNQVTFGSGSTLNSASLVFSSTGTNNIVTFGDNNTINNAVGTWSLSSTYGNKVTFGNNNALTLGTLNLSGVTSSNLVFGSNNAITFSTFLSFIGSNTFTFPADSTIKAANITFGGNTNNITFNNSFDNTATTAIGIANSNNNSLVFGPNAALRLTALNLIGSSNNNTLMLPNSPSSTDIMQLAFLGSTNNNTVTFPANRTFPYIDINFNSTGTNNRITFGASSTLNSASLAFSSTGTNNRVTFGDNNIINNAAGTWTLSGLYSRKVTFGNSNALTLGTLNLNGVTSSNLAFGSNNSATLTNLNFTGSNNLTFPLDTTIEATNINFTGNSNVVVFDNTFNNIVSTTMNFTNSDSNDVTFGANTSIDFPTINFIGTSSNNTITFGISNMINASTLNVTGSTNNNRILLGNNSTITAGSLDFSSASNSNNIAFGSNTTVNSTDINFSGNNTLALPADLTLSVPLLAFTGSSNDVTFDNQFDTNTPVAMTFSSSSGNNTNFGTGVAINIASIAFDNASSNNSINFGASNTITGGAVSYSNDGTGNILNFGASTSFTTTSLDFNSTGDNNVTFGAGSTVTTGDLNYSGTSGEILFGPGSTINASTISPASSSDNVYLSFSGTATLNVDQLGTSNEPITKLNIGTGAVTHAGTSVVATNINFTADGTFDTSASDLTFNSVTTDVDRTGSITLAKANILGDIGTPSLRLKNINFVGTASEIATTACNFYAENVNLGNQPIVLTHDLLLDGKSTINSTKFNLANNTLIFQDTGGSSVTGSPIVAFTLDDLKFGRVVVKSGLVDMNGAGLTNITLKLKDVLTTLPPAGAVGQSYTILGFEAPGQVTLPSSGKVSFVIDQQSPLVVWSYAGGVITRKRLPPPVLAQVISNIITGNGGSQTAALNAALLSNPDNSADASALFEGLHRILILNDEGELIKAINALQSTVVEAAGQIAEVTDQNLSALSNRLGKVRTSAAFAQNEEGAGVAAGDNLYSHGIWLSSVYGRANQKGHKESPGYKSRTISALIGFDTKLNDVDTIGIALSYANNKVNHQDSNKGDKSYVHSYTLSLYGTRELDNNWFMQGIGLFSRNNISNRELRYIVGGTEIAKGDFNVNAYEVQGLTGFTRPFNDKLSIIPTFGAEFLWLDDSKYQEKGTSYQNLLITKRAEHKLNALAGASIAYNTPFNNYNLVLEARSNISYNILNKPAKITARLNGLAVERLMNKTAEEPKVYYNLGCQSTLIKGKTELSASYDLFLGKRYTAHQAAIKLKINF